ncbi:hypothetical protein EV715DRAFT_247243 [Schizophyllum commune]
MATATMDSFDAPMGDFGSDNDIQMNISEPWLTNDMAMDADEDGSMSQEIEMSDHVDNEDPAEFEMLDGEGRAEDVEPRDVEFEDASHSMAAEPFTPQPTELEMTAYSQPSQADASQPLFPTGAETYMHSTVPTLPQEEQPQPGSEAVAHAPTEFQHPTGVSDENAEHPASDSTQPADALTATDGAEPAQSGAALFEEPVHSQQHDPSAIDSSTNPTSTEGTSQPHEHASQPTDIRNSQPQEDVGEAGMVADAFENALVDGDYRPTVLLSTPDPDCPEVYLFNPPPDSTDVRVLLGTRPPTCYYAPLSDLFVALRQQEFVKRLPDIDIAELTVEAYDIRLVISETNPATSSCSLHDFDMIHSNEGLSGYLRLRLTAPVPFIERFSRLKAKFEASLDQMDGNNEQVEENYNEHQHAEEQAEYEQEQEAEQQEQAIPEVGAPQNGDAPDTSAPFEDPSVPTEVPQTTIADHLDADEAHEAAGETPVSADQDSAATTDVYATATGSADQATEYAEHADPYEEGDEGVEQQSYDEYVEQAEGGQEAVVDFNEQQSGQEYAEEQQEEYNEDGYEEGTYDEKVDEKLYGGEHVAQGASDVAGEGEHPAGNDEHERTGHEEASATDEAPGAVAEEYNGDPQPTDPNADPAQLPPLPEDDGDEDDSELTTEGTSYQDPIVVPEPEAQAEGEGEEDVEEEYYEEGEEEYYEEGEYEEEYEEGAEVGEEVPAGEGEGAPVVEAEAEGAPQQAAEDAAVGVGGEAGEVVEDGDGQAHAEASVTDEQVNIEAGEVHAAIEDEHVATEDAEAEVEDDEADAEGEDDVDEDGNDTYGFAQYEPDTTADTTLDLHEVATDAAEQHEADVGEQLEVASNISSTTLSSTSPMPPPKASFAEAAEMQSLDTAFSKPSDASLSKPSDASFSQPLQSSLSRSAKTPLAKSSSKRSLREVEEDDEEGALSGQEMSPGTKRARVEA